MILKIIIDGDNGGVYVTKSKFGMSLCLWWLAIRVYWLSEDQLNRAIHKALSMEME